MANRLFSLPETKGIYQAKGIIKGTESNNFYTSKKTKTNKDFRNVNFGCEYDSKKTIYMNLNGMPQDKVYFSKKNPKTNKTETQPEVWANRNKPRTDGWRLIGVNLGLQKTTDENGKTVNLKKTLVPFDACEEIHTNLKDNSSVFIRGNIEFSSYEDKDGNTRRGTKFVPNQISLCQDVDFDEYSEENKPVHDFTQNIVFMGIEKGEDGRFVVSAKIITYSDIVDTEFYIRDSKLANLFRTKLKPYTAIEVHGKIDVSHSIQEVNEEDEWGESNPMNAISNPTVTEMIITGAAPATIDKETYTEENVSEAIRAIRQSKNAERQFVTETETDNDDWGTGGFDDDDDEDTPW